MALYQIITAYTFRSILQFPARNKMTASTGTACHGEAHNTGLHKSKSSPIPHSPRAAASTLTACLPTTLQSKHPIIGDRSHPPSLSIIIQARNPIIYNTGGRRGTATVAESSSSSSSLVAGKHEAHTIPARVCMREEDTFLVMVARTQWRREGRGRSRLGE